MFPKAHLTSHSRMSGSRWVTTPLQLSRSLGLFFCSSFVYSYHLFLISSASVRSLPFLSFIMPIFSWNLPLIAPTFLKRSLVFPMVLFSSISWCCSLRKAFFSLLALLWNSAFGCVSPSLSPLSSTSLLSQLFVKPPQRLSKYNEQLHSWRCAGWHFSSGFSSSLEVVYVKTPIERQLLLWLMLCSLRCSHSTASS